MCSWSSNTGTHVSGGRSEEAVQRLPPLQTEIGECDSLLVAGSFASSAKVAASGRRVLESAPQRTVEAGRGKNSIEIPRICSMKCVTAFALIWPIMNECKCCGMFRYYLFHVEIG